MKPFNYPIFPDRIYTLSYNGYEYKVSGAEILQMFSYRAGLEKFIDNLDKK